MIRTFIKKDIPIEKILERGDMASGVEEIVAGIIADVRANGDEALYRMTEKFDKVKLDSLLVTQAEVDEAYNALDDEMKKILTESAANIEAFHRHQVRNNFVVNDKDGVVLGQKITPIARVGLYVPGGTAPLLSSVLMNAIPAKIAGCGEIAMTTPPGKDGKVNPAILAAAKVAGVTKIYKMGGAQAIAALAYGTESVSPVDKIVGPGNAFVAEAKKQVFGRVSIDMIAGPSEILVLADKTCDPVVVAADMLSQAEHDKMASAILVTDCAELAAKVTEELERQIPKLPRAEIARVSIDTGSKIIITETFEEAIDMANEIAPEHLEVMCDNPFDYLSKIKNAGSIFLGKNCPEALGDYFAGPNHVLPTSGTAKFSSPLSVDDFIKKSSFIYYTEEALQAVGEKVYTFAGREQLDAHARSAVVRFRRDFWDDEN
ncbi:MAG: histidinol dehydrogenase [Ruminococcaceae bacterium]|nr:histidinol dehydrogenase [Oscillospiraceae bacterium]